jgi:hypothetical protein
MDPHQQYYYNQQQQQDADAQKRYYLGLLQSLYGQNWQNQAQGIYNNMSQAQAGNQLASQQYNIMGDNMNQQLRVSGMQGSMNELTRANAERERQGQEYLQQNLYRQSVSEIPSAAERAKRLLGGAY